MYDHLTEMTQAETDLKAENARLKQWLDYVKAQQVCQLVTQRDTAEAQNVRLKEALQSIAVNTCCAGCQEAKRVAQQALDPQKGQP